MVDDFNLIRFLEERSGEGRLNAEMRRFFEVIEDIELKDHPFQGGTFTWSRGLNGSFKSKLDCFFSL